MIRFLFTAGALVTLGACQDAAQDTSDAATAANGASESPVVVYSARNEQLIGPLLDEYERASGVKTQLVTAKAGQLLERMKAEGETTAADVLLTVDAGNLWQAAEAGLLRRLDNSSLVEDIPEHLRDPKNRWFGLSVRARTIVHHTQRAPADKLSTYEALAEPRFKGRLCLRTSQKVYNQSLVAMLIADHGIEETESIVSGWVANLAAPPFPNDTSVMKAIIAGQCDLGIVNTYYFGRLQRDEPHENLALFWPNQDGSGVHVNISGGGVAAHTDRPAAAQALLEWLGRGDAQQLFAGGNLEYPANPSVDPVDAVSRWGEFKPNLINVSEAGRLQAEAVKLMDRVGYR